MTQFSLITLFLLSAVSESLKLSSTAATPPAQRAVHLHDKLLHFHPKQRSRITIRNVQHHHHQEFARHRGKHEEENNLNLTWCTPFCYTNTILQYQYKAALQACQVNGCYGKMKASVFPLLKIYDFDWSDTSGMCGDTGDHVHSYFMGTMSGAPPPCNKCFEVGMSEVAHGTNEFREFGAPDTFRPHGKLTSEDSLDVYESKEFCEHGDGGAEDDFLMFKARYGARDSCETFEEEILDIYWNSYYDNSFQCKEIFTLFDVTEAGGWECEEKCLKTEDCQAATYNWGSKKCRGCAFTVPAGVEGYDNLDNLYWNFVQGDTYYFEKEKWKIREGVDNKAAPICSS